MMLQLLGYFQLFKCETVGRSCYFSTLEFLFVHFVRTATLHPICLPSWELTRKGYLDETSDEKVDIPVNKLADSSWKGQQFLYSIKVTQFFNSQNCDIRDHRLKNWLIV